MRLLKAKFKNWCQHPDLTLDLSDGLNAIRGPNGSGKSNILTGIVFGLTGDFSRNSGVKVDNIYQLAGDKERAGVSLELIHGTNKVTIERNLRPNSQRLIVEGARPITGADEINAKVRELLGVNERLLLDYVFVDQWKIFAFIDQSAGVRAKAFGELFDATKAATIHKLIGDLKIDVPIPAIDGDKVRVRISETRYEIIQLQTELAKFNHLPEKWSYGDDPLHATVKQWERKYALDEDIVTVRRKLAGVVGALQAYDDQIKPEVEHAAACQKVIDDTRVEAERARRELASWRAYETVNKARAMLENEVEQLKKEREVQQAPVKPANYCGPIYRRDEDQIAIWQTDIADAQRLLNTFDPKTGVAECPTCGTPTDKLQDTLQLAYASASGYREKVLRLRQQIDVSKAHDLAVAKYIDCTKRINDSLHTAEVRLLNLADTSPPVENHEQLTEMVDDWNLVNDELKAVVQELNDARCKRARVEGEKALLDNQLLDMTTEFNSLTVTSEQASEATTQLEHKQEQFNTRSNLRYRLDTKLRLIQDDEAALQKFQLDERKAGRLRRLSAHLDAVRGIFKELPQVAAQACLDSMIEEINDILEKFDAPFRVLNADNLKFTLRKHSGVTLPAERLSGGEKAVFSLAFRIVVNSKFAGSLGLLCLDEPTAGLDEDNVACLEVALGRLRELSTSRGLQVVLITHETGLDGLFDRVIKLSAAH